MNRRRAIVLAAVAPICAALLALALCPRPSLYGHVDFSTLIEDRNGRMLRISLAGDQRYRLRFGLDEIAEAAIDASLLYEDRYFYRHPGFNPLALIRGAWATYIRRDRAIGGSTITMQLARLRFSLDTRSLLGKLAQIARAVQLERHYGKDEILEAYLNLAPYGGNIEGIGTASLIYFDKPPARLSLPEALALAVIPQNPAGRRPTSERGYAEMAAARQRLIELWADEYGLAEHVLQQFELRLAVRDPGELPFFAPHLTQQLLADRRPPAGRRATTLDLSMQRTVEALLQRYVERRGRDGIHNASAMLVDHRDMSVLASIGSADFLDDGIAGQVDGTRAKRSPGSTLKPFVYGLAIDAGLIHPMSLLTDAPMRFAAYTPENFDRGFMGPVLARDALIYSRNVPAADLLARVGVDVFHDFLRQAGVADLKSADHYGLAMVLGGNELTMQELVRLYAMLANGGELKPLRIFSNEELDEPPRRLLSPEASYLVLDMLRDNPRPDAVAIDEAGHAGRPAWKTGTSYAYRDAWSIGIVGPYVLAVWVGNFDGSSNPSFVGRRAAAPLFFEIADALSAARPAAGDDFAQPAPELNLRRVTVCAATGDLPGRYCPRTTESWFIPGVSPIKLSDVHRAIRIDNASGRRSCKLDPATTHEEVYEFWPSDILQQFRKAGIGIRRPPPWAADCPLEQRAGTGRAPRITSPSERLTYHLRADRLEQERLPLSATTDADVEWLFWFANDSLIAKVRPDQAYLWELQAGDYDILAVDDLGRSSFKRLSVSIAQ